MTIPPKSFVIGASGFIGSSFLSILGKSYSSVIGTTRSGEYSLDLLAPQVVFSTDGYDAAIIAAGCATPQRCLAEPELCTQVDLEGVVELCRMLVKRGIVPVVFSTSQVFDGTETLYTSSSLTTPKNLYGQLHADRERILMEEMADHCLILRLCRVYNESHNVIFEIVEELCQQGRISAAVDQELQLVSMDEVISCVFELQRQNRRGIYQICPEESVTRYELACYIAEQLGMSLSCVRPICMADIDNIPRPKSAQMASCFKVKHWKEGVDKVVLHRKRCMGRNQEALSTERC